MKSQPKTKVKITKESLELSWAAGFYDGEGSSKKVKYHYKSKKGLPKKPNENVSMSLSQCDLAPLKRFLKAVSGIGRINGPYQYYSNKRPYWVWSTSCSSADKVFNMLKPFLCSAKKKQFMTVKKEVTSPNNRKKGWLYDES
jgi:hypothetical protein